MTTKPMIDRKEALVRCAKARAAIIALLGSTDQPMPISAIRLNENVTATGVDPRALESLIWRMAKDKLIGSEKRKNVTYYMPASASSRPVPRPENPYKLENGSKGLPQSSKAAQPEIKVDVVRSTGRVRLTLGGLVIEIGVVP